MKPSLIKQYSLSLLVFVLFLVGCGGGGVLIGEEPDEIDPDTGLPLNPTVIPNQEFVVEGTITSLTLIPQSAPEFLVQAPSGKLYRIRAQPLSEIFYEDGEVILPREYRQGMMVRATISPVAGGTGTAITLVSEDLTILKPPVE